MAITQRGVVGTAAAMVIIEGGECVPPSMRTSGERGTEQAASAELEAVAPCVREVVASLEAEVTAGGDEAGTT